MKTLVLLLVFFGPVQLSSIFHHIWYNPWPRTWTDAQRFCQRHRAELVTARSAADLKKTMDIYHAWFGLHRPSSQQDWQWLDGTSTNNVPNTFTYNPTNNANCAHTQYNYNRVYSILCGHVIFFFCQDSKGHVTFVNQTKTWAAARDHCRGMSQELATFSTSSANAPTRTKRSFPVWTGLHGHNGSWVWSSGLQSEYRNWASAAGSAAGLSPSPGSGSCVAVSSQSKSMSVRSCSEALPVLCQRHHVVLVQKSLSWEQALDHCRNISTDLRDFWTYYPHSNKPLDLLSLEEKDLEFALRQAKGANTTKVWLGLRFLAGSWMWSDGAAFALTSLPLCPEFECGALDLDSRSIRPTDCDQPLNLLCYQPA